MVFYADPNHLVVVKKMKKQFLFDSKGEYNTEDLKLIKILKPHFKYKQNKKEEKNEI